LFAPPGPHGSDEPQATAVARRATQTDPDDDGLKTLLLERTTAGQKAESLRTAPSAGVTRVGAILGTPLYMSPEQCRGQRLDARSDIYSLGVIAYQMLAGETPFDGDMVSVMRQHMDAAPPPLRSKNRKVKKKVAQLVMSVLSKDPDERPASAAAFAAAMRGNFEGIGSLLRRAFALYSEHFPKFLRMSLIAHVPFIVVTLLLIGFEIMTKLGMFSKPLQIIIGVPLGLLLVVANFIAASVITGMTTLIVTQLHIAPMRPVRLRTTYAAFRRRLRPFLRTSIRVSLTIMLGFTLLVIPGLIIMIRYALYAPVVLMEGLEKRAALKRANELSRRSRRTVIGLLAINLVLPMLLGATVTFFSVKTNRAAAGIDRDVLARISQLFNIITVPLLSIMTALLYLKMRQIGGETFKDALGQLEDAEAPRTKWQERMRRRLTVNAPTSRG
jgi:hypothetical protein